MKSTREILTLAVEIADTMLESGGEIYRAQDTIMHILNSNNIYNFDAYVLSNGIFASANENMEDDCSIIRYVQAGSMNLNKLAALNQLSRKLSNQECSLDDAWKELEDIRNLAENSNKNKLLFTGLGSAGFCYVFGGSLLDSLCTFFIALILEVFLLNRPSRKSAKFTGNIFGSALITTLSLMLAYTGFPVSSDAIITGCVMPLVPGVAIATSIRDFFNLDYLSGLIHLIDAILTAMCIALGVSGIIGVSSFFLH